MAHARLVVIFGFKFIGHVYSLMNGTGNQAAVFHNFLAAFENGIVFAVHCDFHV